MSEKLLYIDKIRKHLPKEAYRELRIKLENTSEDKKHMHYFDFVDFPRTFWSR